LTKELDAGVTFGAFEWSGDNSHSARLAAGQELALHLEDLLTESRNRPLFVIGHSHGGTVITHALRDRPALARALGGVVFLSTPFIQLRRRPHANALAAMIGAMLVLTVVAASDLAADAMYAMGWPRWAISLGGIAVLIAIGIGLIAGMYESAPATQVTTARRKSKAGDDAPGDKLVSRLDRAIHRLLEEFSVRNLDRRRTLIIRANADEASAALAWVQAVSRLIGDVVAAMLRWVQLLVPWVAMETREHERGRRGLMYWVAGCAAAVGFTYLVFLLLSGLLALFVNALVGIISLFGTDLPHYLRHQWPTLALYSDHVLIGVAWINSALFNLVKYALLGFATVLGLAALPLAAFNRAFGRWFLWTALFVEVSVESAPPGRWMIHQLQAPDQTKEWHSARGAVLAHSLSYDDTRAQSIIARWIRDRSVDAIRKP
jgi:MFS family permease